MIIQEKVYELPTEETHSLTIIEYKDLGVVETLYGKKEKVSLKIEVTDQKGEDGSPIYVFVNAAKSIGPKSTLGIFLRKIGVNVQGQVDMDDLVGYKFHAVIEHNTAPNGKVYANVGSIIKTKSVPVEV
jgi:hypothetical protein